MRQIIWLPENEPRCVPTACTKGQPCARREIPQAFGRTQCDFSQPAGYNLPECCALNSWARFVPLSAAVKPVEQRKARDWIGS